MKYPTLFVGVLLAASSLWAAQPLPALVDIYSIRTTRPMSDAQRLKWYGTPAAASFDDPAPDPLECVLQISCPDRLVAGVVPNSLAITQWTDDQKTDLTKGSFASFRPYDLGLIDSYVGADAHQVLVGVVSKTAPVPGAKKFILRGSIKLLIGSEEKTVDVPQSNGDVDLGGIAARIQTSFTPNPTHVALMDVTLSSSKPLDSIRKVEFFTANGLPIPCTPGLGIRARSEMPGSTTWHYELRPSGPIDHAHITYYNKTEVQTIPIELMSGVDLQPLPPAPASAPAGANPAARPAENTESRAQVFSLRISKVLSEVEQNALFPHPAAVLARGNGGTDLSVCLEVPKARIFSMDSNDVRIDQFADDQQNNLLDPAARLLTSMPGRSTNRAADDDGHRLWFRIVTPKVPAAGAERLALSGAATVRVVTGDPSVAPPEHLLLANAFGPASTQQIHYANSVISILTIARGYDNNSQVVQMVLKVPSSAMPITSIDFYDTDGQLIPTKMLGSAPGATGSAYTLNYVLYPKGRYDLGSSPPLPVDAKVTYYEKMEQAVIPFNFNVGLGVGE